MAANTQLVAFHPLKKYYLTLRYVMQNINCISFMLIVELHLIFVILGAFCISKTRRAREKLDTHLKSAQKNSLGIDYWDFRRQICVDQCYESLRIFKETFVLKEFFRILMRYWNHEYGGHRMMHQKSQKHPSLGLIALDLKTMLLSSKRKKIDCIKAKLGCHSSKETMSLPA